MLNYTPTPASLWTGRTDSTTQENAFRWHQVVTCLDLTAPPKESLEGVGLIGFASDLGIELNQGRLGAKEAPEKIRQRLGSLPVVNPNVAIYDCGTISVGDLSLTKAQQSLAEAVAKIKSLGLRPFVLGGGHETSLGHYQGLQKVYSESKIGILNFDAHFDNRPYEETGPSSGTMFRQIADTHHKEGLSFHYGVLGVQKQGNTRQLFETADQSGTSYVYAEELAVNDFKKARQLIDELAKNTDGLMITIDLDVFSQAYAPGVSAPQPFGVTPREVQTLLTYALNHTRVLSVDMVELSPPHDHEDQTANLAAQLVAWIINHIQL